MNRSCLFLALSASPCPRFCLCWLWLAPAPAHVFKQGPWGNLWSTQAASFLFLYELFSLARLWFFFNLSWIKTEYCLLLLITAACCVFVHRWLILKFRYSHFLIIIYSSISTVLITDRNINLIGNVTEKSYLVNKMGDFIVRSMHRIISH